MTQTQIFRCGDNPALVGFMYGECEPAERHAIEQHVRVCPACAAELEALGATRIQLASWTPPDARLGFRMVSEAAPSNVVRRWWAHPMPAWAQVAAASVIFAAGLSLGVWRGTASPDAPATGASAGDLAALEQRLRAEMALMRASTTTAPSAAAPQTASASEAQILARVRTLIDESEQRQQRELALRTAQVVRDFDSQRRVDLQNVGSMFGKMEGTTGAEIARQQQTLQYLMRVSQQR